MTELEPGIPTPAEASSAAARIRNSAVHNLLRLVIFDTGTCPWQTHCQSTLSSWGSSSPLIHAFRHKPPSRSASSLQVRCQSVPLFLGGHVSRTEQYAPDLWRIVAQRPKASGGHNGNGPFVTPGAKYSR